MAKKEHVEVEPEAEPKPKRAMLQRYAYLASYQQIEGDGITQKTIVAPNWTRASNKARSLEAEILMTVLVSLVRQDAAVIC